ncbi:DUF402 domain-containing protein [Streptomyces sp. R302]|uniref:DUF402 domain-containing protein n=1 Tax=unclassified Streptomyces TaxID=2593676 RepID=UPI00145C5CA8|nr:MULTISPECIES: DUF402 domain-containing protein [unclassified Streptomyces]NML52664.1 DUF402 domain-containing protein [Streptomyces sp. R301]NML80407.1 DUF402 domain-containing protein [Streptomyces sp. R302]
MRIFEPGDTVVRRDRRPSGRPWSEHALRAVADTEEALVAACAPGAQVRRPVLYEAARKSGDRMERGEALEQLAAGDWQLTEACWHDTELLLWKPPEAWYSVNAFFTPPPDGCLRHWYVNFEHPIRRTGDGFDTFDLAVDLIVSPDLGRHAWKDEDEYAHARRLGVIDDTEHAAVSAARDEVLALIAARAGVFAHADHWAAWRWNPSWPLPRLPAE